MHNPEKSVMSCHSILSPESALPVYINSEHARRTTPSSLPYKKAAMKSRIVTYVKSDCDSGYVCLEMSYTSTGVTHITLGAKSTNPSEACTHLYFSKSLQRKLLFVSPHSPPQPCPLSGRYSLQPLATTTRDNALSAAAHQCRKPGWMHISAGCRSTSLNIESDCEDAAINKSALAARYSCSAAWSAHGQNFLVVRAEQTGRTFCLTYGDKTLSVSGSECGDMRGTVFSMSETAPCLQALSSHPTTASAASVTGGYLVLACLILAFLCENSNR